MTIVGRTYYERGRPVVILVQWRTGDGPAGPKNVRIRRKDGSVVVRPLRGPRTPASRPHACGPAQGEDRQGAEPVASGPPPPLPSDWARIRM